MSRDSSSLLRAKAEKNDEYYTYYDDIEAEMQHYKELLKGKIVYCNCDEYRFSNFVKYFRDHFDELGLKELRAVGYHSGGRGSYYVYDGLDDVVTELNGDGDFMSEECKKILADVDIVITNPPFSLMINYLKVMWQSGKLFTVIANQNTAHARDLFWLFANKVLGFGYNKVKKFRAMDDKDVYFGYIGWVTNTDIRPEPKEIKLTKSYNPTDYPMYDNADVINVDKLKDIPYDYKGLMGVPAGILEYYDPEQFEVVGVDADFCVWSTRFQLNDAAKYTRVVIRLTDSYYKKMNDIF